MDISIVEAKNKKPSLKVVSDDGTVKTIHSLYDPEREAINIVNAFEFDGSGLLVVLGLGLGYHLRELEKRFPGAGIIVVEALPEIYELSKIHVAVFNSKIEFIVGVPHNEVIKRITALLIKRGIPSLSVFTLSSSVAAFSEYYRPIINSLENKMSESVSRKIERTMMLLEGMLSRLKYENISSKMSSRAGDLCFELGLYENAKYFYERTIAIDSGRFGSFNDLAKGAELEDMKEYWDSCAQDNAMRHIATDDWQSEEVFHKCGERDLTNLLSNLDEEILTGNNKRALEIGCGIGRLLKPFAMRYPELELFGVDVSEEMVSKGRQRLNEFENIKLFRTGGKDLCMFDDNSFHFIYSYVVFQHIPRKFVHNYFKEVARIIDKDGCFVFQMPMLEEDKKPQEPPDSDFRTVRYYSLEEVHMLCRSKGLDVVKTSRCGKGSLWFKAVKI